MSSGYHPDLVEIAYVGVGTGDLPGWRQLADDVLGLESAQPSEEVLRLRMDERDYRIEVSSAHPEGLAHIGFAARDEQALEAVVGRLSLAGHKVIEEGDEQAARRRVAQLVTTEDPNGHRVEICCGPMTRTEDAFAPKRPHGGFVTGDQGFGHVTMSVTDLQDSLGFYRDVLGLRISDYIQRKDTGRKLAFLRTFGRHHTLAIWSVPDDPQPLKHLMLQLESIDDLGRALDVALDAGLVTKGLGRHTNDGMLSFYMRTPSGFEVEYGWGGKMVGENEPMILHEVGSSWGHRPLS